MTSEHIIIADELADHSIDPTNINRKMSIRNRVKGVITHLIFFDEGYLKVLETRKGKRAAEHMLELRFLDSDPVTSTHAATAFLWSSLALGLLALLAAFALPMTEFSQYALSATVAFAAFAVIALLLFIHRSETRHQFCTASGMAITLTLRGSFGCIRQSRAAMEAVRKAISAARADTATRNDADYLRAEMKAHYKLAETGLITRKACADGTTLILSKFD